MNIPKKRDTPEATLANGISLERESMAWWTHEDDVVPSFFAPVVQSNEWVTEKHISKTLTDVDTTRNRHLSKELPWTMNASASSRSQKRARPSFFNVATCRRHEKDVGVAGSKQEFGVA
jgi:hypothetical protein